MSDKYILNSEGEPILEPDLVTWAKWFEKAERQVAYDSFQGCKVSTVFLGLDHNFGAHNDPVLWETMVFGGPLKDEQTRCSGTRKDACAMHQRMVEKVNTALASSP